MELEATTSLFYGFYESIYLDYEKISWSDQERAEYFNTIGLYAEAILKDQIIKKAEKKYILCFDEYDNLTGYKSRNIYTD